MCLEGLSGCHIIDCISHIKHIGVKKLLGDYCAEIWKGEAIIRKFSYQISGAQLRRLEKFKEKMANKTRWSSTYNMIKR